MSIPLNMLKQVSNERLMNYLMDKGWTERRVEQKEIISLISPSGYEVIIPAQEFLVDYDSTMENAIEMVSYVDDVSVDDVLADILSPPVIKLVEIQYIVKRLESLVDKYGEDVVLKDVLELLRERERMLEILAPMCDALGDK